MRRGFWLSVLGYTVITMGLGMAWHFVWFHGLYERLGIYNRHDPIIPLGMLSMLIQGIILAYLYPLFYRAGSPLKRGITYGLIMGAYLYSVSTLANAAKIMVSSMPLWLGIQTAFHAIQFVLAGAVIGLAYGRIGKNGV